MYNLSMQLNQIILTTKKILEGSHGRNVTSSSDIPCFNFPCKYVQNFTNAPLKRISPHCIETQFKGDRSFFDIIHQNIDGAQQQKKEKKMDSTGSVLSTVRKTLPYHVHCIALHYCTLSVNPSMYLCIKDLGKGWARFWNKNVKILIQQECSWKMCALSL